MVRLIVASLIAAGVVLTIGTIPALAQTPEPSPSPSPSVRPTQIPADPNATIILRATLKLDVSGDGNYARIPEGSRVQVLVGEGRICFDWQIPSSAIAALEASKSLQLPPITIPLAAVDRNCPSESETFGVIIAFPGGGMNVLLTSGWNPGVATVELVIPAPLRSGAPVPASPALPATGMGSQGPSAARYLFAAALLGAACGLLLVRRKRTS